MAGCISGNDLAVNWKNKWRETLLNMLVRSKNTAAHVGGRLLDVVVEMYF